MSVAPDATQASALADVSLTFIIRVLGAGLTFALQILLARLMTVEAYGSVVTLWTWLLAIGSFAALGLAESSVRFLPRYRLRGREEHVRHFWHFGFHAVLLASSALALTALVISHLIGQGNSLIALYVALGLPFLAIEYYLEGIARSFGWFRLTIIPVYIIRPLLIGGVCTLLTVLGITLSLSVVCLVIIAAMAAISCCLALIMACRLAGLNGARAPKRERLWLRASLPLLVISGLEDMMTHCDILLLSLMLPPADVAIYFAASRTLALANFIHYALYFISGRRFALALAGNDKTKLRRSLRASAQLTFWLTFASVLATLAAGPLLLAAFGKAFAEGYLVMFILGSGLVMRGLAGQAGEFLIVAGMQKENLVISAGALMLNVTMAVMLIPLLGIEGAALATAATMAVRSAALLLIVRRRTTLRTVAVARATAT